MPIRKPIALLKAPDLVKKWVEIVNESGNPGRDSHLFANLLLLYTPAQIILGMYQYKKNPTMTVPAFARNPDNWVEDDLEWAEVKLAIHVSGQTPKEYYILEDNKDSVQQQYFQMAIEARKFLEEWAGRILS